MTSSTRTRTARTPAARIPSSAVARGNWAHSILPNRNGNEVSSTLAGSFVMISVMKQQLHIKVSGGLEGDFVVTEERGGDEFVITRESVPSLKGIRERAGAREATDEEFSAFEADHGPFLPPDGEG